jgi:penicillin-binding protein 1C
MVTPERFARRLVALGLPIRKPGGFYGYSLALGSAEVNLLALANAYRALANDGRVAPPRLLAAGPPATPATQAMDPAAAWIVADILADNGARVPTFGLDNALATRYWSAVKTGTSKDMRDNWCIGFDARYTVGVWVGNASGAPMHAVSGVTGAAPVWRTVMDALQRGAVTAPLRPAEGVAGREEAGARGMPPAAQAALVAVSSGATSALAGPRAVPPGLVSRGVEFPAGLEAARDEWFLAGTETERVALASAAGTGARRISSPEDGAVVAIDPDMPAAVQRLRFEAAAPVPPGAAWRLDGKRLGPARPLPWMPWPGRHVLELLDGGGAPLDTVSFDVRGAQASPDRGSSRAPAARALRR